MSTNRVEALRRELEQEFANPIAKKKAALVERLREIEAERAELREQIGLLNKMLVPLQPEQAKQTRKARARSNGAGTRLGPEKTKQLVEVFASHPQGATTRQVAEETGLHSSTVVAAVGLLREQELVTPVGRSPRRPGQIGPTAMLYAPVKENVNAFLAQA